MLDLGAGKFPRSGLLTTNGETLGTMPYMSPEQMSPSNLLDRRSDICLLGVVLLELVSGVHPFAARGLDNENMFTLVSKIVGGPPLAIRGFAP